MSELWKKSLTHQFTWKLNCLNGTNSAWPLLVFKEWTTVKTPAGVSHILTSEKFQLNIWTGVWRLNATWCQCTKNSCQEKQANNLTAKQCVYGGVIPPDVWSFPLLSVIHKFKMLDTHVKQCPKFCITRWVYASQIFRVQTDLKSQFCTVFFLFLSLSDVKEQWLCKWAAVLFKPSLCKGQPIKGKLSESLH